MRSRTACSILASAVAVVGTAVVGTAVVGTAVAGTAVVTAGVATASTGVDIGVTTGPLRFRPPATLPDDGTVDVTVENLGSGSATGEDDSRTPVRLTLRFTTYFPTTTVSIDGVACESVPLASTCALSGDRVPAVGGSVTLTATVTVGGRPAEWDDAAAFVQPALETTVIAAGDPGPGNNRAVAEFHR